MRGRVHRGRNLRAALLALAAGAAAVGACTRAHDCRPGTLFLNVQFAPYSGVQRVFVEVMVAGETTRSMTFDVQPPAADSGGVAGELRRPIRRANTRTWWSGWKGRAARWRRAT